MASRRTRQPVVFGRHKVTCVLEIRNTKGSKNRTLRKKPMYGASMGLFDMTSCNRSIILIKEKQMKRSIKVVVLSGLVIMAASLLGGCTAGPSKPALYFDPDSFHPEVSVVHVMPILDARTDKTAKFDEADRRNLLKRSQKRIKSLGYDVEIVDKWTLDVPASEEELAAMTPEQLCGFAPQECQVFFTLAISDIHSAYKVMSTSYSITGTAMLINQHDDRLIWKEIATGTYGGGGLLGAAMDGMVKETFAKDFLMGQLFASFPKKPKN